ncbi:Satratoxin biosynthesis SC1 cluster protein 4 [Apiospora sp. TS-2023a]
MGSYANVPGLPANVGDYRLIDLFGKGAYDNLGEEKPWSNDADTLKILTILFMALSWAFVTFRLYIRLRTVRSAGLDDFFVFLYLLCTWTALLTSCTLQIAGSAGSISFIVSLDYGAGQHMILLTIDNLQTFLLLFYLMNGFFNLGSAFIKLSLLFQYLRIFPRGTWIWRATVAVACAVAVWGFTFSFLAFFPCSKGPNFNPLGADRGAYCWAYGSNDPDIFTMTFNAHTVMNMVFDLIILVLPFQLYMNKTMTNKMRLGLLALLFMGALVNFLSIWRLQTIFEHKTGWYPTHDPTWYGPISILLGVLEINVASICASVPIFWPVVAPYLGSIFVTHEVSVQVVEYRDLDEEAGSTRPGTGSRGNSKQQLHHQRSDSEIRLNSLPFPADRKGSAGVGGNGDKEEMGGRIVAPPVVDHQEARVDRWFDEEFAGYQGPAGGSPPRSGGHLRTASSQSRVRSDSVRRKDRWYQI